MFDYSAYNIALDEEAQRHETQKKILGWRLRLAQIACPHPGYAALFAGGRENRPAHHWCSLCGKVLPRRI